LKIKRRHVEKIEKDLKPEKVMGPFVGYFAE